MILQKGLPLVVLILATHDYFLFLLGASTLLLLLSTSCAARSAILINIHSRVLIVIICFIWFLGMINVGYTNLS